jgi:rhodanese-related sulfurtransferase
MPTLIKEILVIALGSTIIAFVYNYFSPNGIPLIRVPKVEKVAPDSLLFGNTNSSTSMETPSSDHQAMETEQSSMEEKNALEEDQAHSTNETHTTHDQANDAHGEDKFVVSYEQVQRLLENPDVLFIDARQEAEYNEGKIGEAIHIYTPEFEENLGKVLGLSRDKIIVVYCGGGMCELSHELADNLRVFGFTKVFVYTGGWTEWTEKQGL